jgi:hypothetical protein
MGETGVADNSDPANIFFNPANVVGARHVYLGGSFWEWTDHVNQGAGSVGVGWDGSWDARPLAFGIDFTLVQENDDTPRVIYLPDGTITGGWNEHLWSLTLGAGVLLAERWEVRLGAAGKRFWEEDQGQGPADAFGFDVGTTVAYRASASGWRVTPAAAMAFVNIGPTLKETEYFDLEFPTRFHYGISVRIESPVVQVNEASVPLLSMTCNLDGVDRFYGDESSWGFATEFALAEILFLRTGVIHEEKLHEWHTASSPWSSLGVGIGVPVQSFRFRFDYARLPHFLEQDRYGVYLTQSF